MITKTAIVAYYEKTWRLKAATNSKLKFLNVQATGLTGRPHPVLSGILTTQEVTRSRVHVKMLAGDYPCYSYLASDRGQDESCRLCKEDMVHLLTLCRGTADTRARLTPVLLNTISQRFPTNGILDKPNHSQLTQLILDPTSLNLPMTIRIPPNHPELSQVLSMCHILCSAIHKHRTNQLKNFVLNDF